MFDLVSILTTFGYVGLLFITFAESGILIGFLFPGDSLLFTAGFLASQHHLNIIWVVVLSLVGAIVGDSVGYAFGKKIGPRLFHRTDSLLFHSDHLKRAQSFYEHHGGKTIIMARFIPFIRTFAPIVAGIGNMEYGRFAIYNIVGGIMWAVGISLSGYFLGNLIPNIDRFLLPIVVVIITVTTLPGLIHIVRDPHVQTIVRRSFSKKST